MTFQEFLQQQRAWQPAIDWAKGKTLKEFWETCINSHWLVWLLKEFDFPKRTFQELAILLAESATHLMRDERSKKAVADLRRWLNGEQVDLEKLRRFAINAALSKNSQNAETCVINAANAALAETAYYAFLQACLGFIHAAGRPNIIRNHITFRQVAEMATKIRIEI